MDAMQIAGPVILFLLMTIVGLELTLADFRRVLAAPRAVVGGTLGQWIILPAVTWLVVVLFDLRPAFGAGAVLVAVSPGAGISNIFVALARANTALSVTLTATSSVFAVITLPTIASFAIGAFLAEDVAIRVPVTSLIGQLMVTLLVPIALGMALRARNPDRAAALAPRLTRLTFVVIALVVVVGIATAPEEQRNFEGSGRALFAAAVWTVLAGGVGWTIATLLGLVHEDRFTFLVEFGARNIAVAAIVALSGLERADLAYFSGLYATAGYPVVALAVVARRRLTRPT